MSRNILVVKVDKVTPGVILGETIYDNFGNILLSEGIVLKDSYIDKLKEYGISRIKIYEEAPINNSLSNDSLLKYNSNEDTLEQLMDEARGVIKNTMKSLYIDEYIDVKEIEQIISRIIDEISQNGEIILYLDKLLDIDEYTFEHSVSVCVLSLMMGLSLGLKKEELKDLGTGAFLHDIGKVFIPYEIINKPGVLTREEYEIVKKHTLYGYDALKKNNFNEKVTGIVLSHHERLDGNGYPRALKGNLIDVYSRIVAISDVFHALTSDRVYKKKIDVFKAITYILQMIDTQFDRELVQLFINGLGIYPTGTIVKLNTMEIGKVVKINRQFPKEPLVKIIYDRDGCEVKENYFIDIRKNPSIKITNFNGIK